MPVILVGAVIAVLGLAFESVGDRQLAHFAADPANRSKVLRTGLWRYTRHPNYFGDVCLWWGIFLIASHWPPGIISIVSPLLTTLLLARSSGKPLLEKRLHQSRPEYADYVERTSGFIPRLPKRD